MRFASSARRSNPLEVRYLHDPASLAKVDRGAMREPLVALLATGMSASSLQVARTLSGAIEAEMAVESRAFRNSW